MQNLKNRLLKIVVGWMVVLTFLFTIFFVVNLIPTKKSVENNAGFETKFVKLAEIKGFRGSIIARDYNLSRIEVLFKNPNLESRDELKIAITDSQKTIYEQNFTGFNFGDTSRARLDFAPITNSKNMEYTVNIIPVKIIDGKLSFGVKNNNLDMIHYYNILFNIKNSFTKSINLLLNRIFLVPLVLLVIFLW